MRVKSITDVLRKAMAESAVPSKTLAKATGVSHPTIMRFRRGEQETIHLNAADRLAAYFGLELRPVETTKARRRTTK